MATRSSVATENFTGTDGTDLGAPWAQIGNSSNIRRLSNTGGASHVGQAGARHTGTYTDNQYAKVTLAGTLTAGLGDRIGAIVRASGDTGANRDWYGYEVHTSAGVDDYLYKVVNGTRTELVSNFDISPWAVGDTVEIEVEGTALRGYRNGVLTASATDAALSTGKPGVASQSGPTTLRADDWEGGNLISASAALVFRSRAGVLMPLIHF